MDDFDFDDDEGSDHQDYDANYFDNGEGDDDSGGEEGKSSCILSLLDKLTRGRRRKQRRWRGRLGPLANRMKANINDETTKHHTSARLNHIALLSSSVCTT